MDRESYVDKISLSIGSSPLGNFAIFSDGAQSYPSGGKADPYKAYLEALYKQIVQYLDKTVFSVLPGHTNTSLLS